MPCTYVRFQNTVFTNCGVHELAAWDNPNTGLEARRLYITVK